MLSPPKVCLQEMKTSVAKKTKQKSHSQSVYVTGWSHGDQLENPESEQRLICLMFKEKIKIA